jgi:D-arabinonate dehydratase
MKPVTIERVEVVALQIPLEKSFSGSSYRIEKKMAIVTRVHCSDGITGEAVNGEGELALQPGIVGIVQGELAQRITGKDPTAIEARWADMWQSTWLGGRDRRASVRAVACLDCALWDAQGKRLGVPLRKLWGGHRDEVQVIAMGGYYVEGWKPADYGREIEEFKVLGLAGCKFKVGGKTPREDAERFAAARGAGGKDFILVPDANRGWSVPEAVEFAKLAEKHGIRWFEEPCHWNNDRRDMRRVREAVGLPLGAGQSEMSLEGCRDLIAEGAVDVCNLDASWGGGASVWLRLAGVARAYGCEMAHHGEPILGGQLIASVAHGTYMETHHPLRDPLFHKLVVDRNPFRNGLYKVPDAPGWGVTLDAALVAKYKVN